MTRQLFRSLINKYKELDNAVQTLYHDLDINIIDSLLYSIPTSLFDIIWSSYYNKDGIEWIQWWLEEPNNKAWDENNNEIDLSSIDKLWKFLKDYEV